MDKRCDAIHTDLPRASSATQGIKCGSKRVGGGAAIGGVVVGVGLGFGGLGGCSDDKAACHGPPYQLVVGGVGAGRWAARNATKLVRSVAESVRWVSTRPQLVKHVQRMW